MARPAFNEHNIDVTVAFVVAAVAVVICTDDVTVRRQLATAALADIG
jgi:hypothetical protein